jgi:hypothetical protein
MSPCAWTEAVSRITTQRVTSYSIFSSILSTAVEAPYKNMDMHQNFLVFINGGLMMAHSDKLVVSI